MDQLWQLVSRRDLAIADIHIVSCLAWPCDAINSGRGIAGPTTELSTTSRATSSGSTINYGESRGAGDRSIGAASTPAN